MSRTDGGTSRNDAELESSEESRFSDAGPRPSLKHSKRKRKKDKKRAGKGTCGIDDDFDDHDFTFRQRAMDTRGDDSGGSLGARLKDSLNAMASPIGGGGPMKKIQARKQEGGNKHQAGGHGERSRSTSARRAQQARGTSTYRNPSSYLDRADEERSRDMHVAGGGTSNSFSRTGSSATKAPVPRAKSNKNGGKAHRGPGWTSTQRNNEPSLSVGPLGMIKKPSTQTKRSKDKRAMNQPSNQQQREVEDPIDMTLDDHDGGAVNDGSSNKSPPPQVQAAKNDDELYGIAGTFLPEIDMKASKRDGVDWELNSDEYQNFSDSEDFAVTRQIEPSNGKRKTESKISQRESSSEPIQVDDDEKSGSQSSGRSFLNSVKSATKLWRGSGSGSKKGKDKQDDSGKRKKKQKIVAGSTFGQSQEDDIESYGSADEEEGRKKQTAPNALSGKKDGGSKSTGIEPSNFHAKKSKLNTRSMESYLSGGKSKRSSQYGESGSISPKQPPRRSKRYKKTHQNDVITIEDDSSDHDDSDSSDDDDMKLAKQNSLTETSNKKRNFGRRIEFDAARVAVGKKVFSHQCKLQIQLGSAQPFLRISYVRDGASSSSKKVVHTIHDESIEELRYFLAEQDEEEEGEDSLQATASSGGDGLSFLAMRITPTKKNGLKTFSSAYLQNCDEDDSDKRYVVIELRSDDDFIAALDEKLRGHSIFGGYFTEESRLDQNQAKKYSSALIEDDRKDRQNRASMPGKRKTRSSTRAAAAKSESSENKIHLVFPFDAEEEIFEEACKNLQELGGKVPVASEEGLNWEGPVPRSGHDEHLSSVSRSAGAAASASEEDGEGGFSSTASAPSKASTRTHFMTIRQDEMERLEQGEFLNDTLIDFFMRWIWRNDDPETSAVHFFTSHFFTTLDEEGPAAVSSWTAKKNIDIFKKRFVFIPINESLHWSLCVVVNPGAISNEYVDEDDQSDDQDFPCILFLDSLKAHRKARVATKVRNWLNHEAKRLGKFTELFEAKNPKLFNKETMEVIDPKVPYQDNSWDCGVFVCRYAYALYLMRNKQITYEAAGLENRPYFLDLITKSPEFNFNMVDIGRVRDELKELITNLSPKYFEAKAKEKLEQDEKRKAKKRKVQAEATAKASTDAKDGEEKKSEEDHDEAVDGAVDMDVDGAEV
eukprot:CAMPEP_0181044106 /NCGR_PEP_ID=MMETSP1070-20121207/13080_1 /TAXON_ID=265543 /ORGANISM="Minutocellus polymorphus, Strain NH13" /LENGTH=1161 /DNA_ID=CAMNT_0023122511 /DNA_START=127 /DNA_END=3612 /DNA_ORIENTATION=+